MKTISRTLASPGSRVKKSKPKRITGRRLQAIRLSMWTTDPHCAQCSRLTAHPYGFEVDHIVELQDGGLECPENRQLLCLPCHEVKTRARRNGK